MKKNAFLIILCLLLTVCPAVHAEHTNRYVFLTNDEPQMQIKMSASWSVAPVEMNRHPFMGFDPIQEFAHRDGIHTLRVYFIPYNDMSAPSAGLNLIEGALSSYGIQTQSDALNGAFILKGILAPAQNGYGVIMQDTMQYGFFAVIGCPQKGADIVDQDEEIQAVLLSVSGPGGSAYSVQRDESGRTAAKEQTAHPAQDPARLQDAAAELKAQYDAAAETVSKLEEKLSALKASYSSQRAELSALETEAAAIEGDAEILLSRLKEAQSELEILSAYAKCGNCGYLLSWDPDFAYCPKCGTARSIPEEAQYDLTERHYQDLQADAATLQARYEGVAALAKNKRQSLEATKAANAALDADIQKAQDELEKAKTDAAELQKQLEEALEALQNQGKCGKCGYVFSEDSTFNFCPKCGTPR